jgi:uncharacterized protein YbjT (DUF2867 family)
MKATKALLVGATGATGSQWLQILLQDPEVEKVVVMARSKTNLQHPKLQWIICDLLSENALKDFPENTDVVICCIGTTAAQTPNKETYKAIDFGIPVNLIKKAKSMGANTFAVVSAMGANSNSRVFYNKTKGNMEQEIKKNALPNTFIFRPSLISANRNGLRIGEKIADFLMSLLDFLIPNKYKRIKASDLAVAMHGYISNNQKHGIHIVESDILQQYKKRD